MSSLTTTHEMNDQSKTEIRQVSQFLVHPHPPDRFHIHYFFYIAFRSDPMRNTQSQFLLVLPLKSPRADKNPGFPLLASRTCGIPHVRGTLDINRESNIHAAARTMQTPISIHALHEESDSAAGHFCPLFETQASCLALSISNNTADTTNNMSKTSNWLSVSF